MTSTQRILSTPRMAMIVVLAVIGLLWSPLAMAQADTPNPDPVPSPDPPAAERPASEPAPKDGAADEMTEAEVLKADGDAAMLDLRYDDALAAYEKAYALDPNPALLYNQGRAHQARGDFPEALAMLQRFDATAPPDLKARVPRLADLIAEVEQKVTTLTVVVSLPGAKVMVRKGTIGISPVATTKVNSGEATISASLAKYRIATQKVTLVGGQAQTVKLTLVPLATTGLLQVKSVAGARVFVDGRDVGAVPADVELKPGTYKVVVRHEDYEEADTTVVIAAGVTKLHNVELVPIPPLIERWWFWSGIGAVTATAAAVVVAAVLEGPIEEGNIEPGAVSAPLITIATF